MKKHLLPADYDTAVKKELLAEIASRQQQGREIEVKGNTVVDLIAALKADDANTSEKPEVEEVTPADLGNEAVARHDGVLERQVPDDLSDYKGQYVYLGDQKVPNEVWGLKIVPHARGGKTHHAKSALRFGDYTPEEFRKQFDKI